jgi:beta-galactosidase
MDVPGFNYRVHKYENNIRQLPQGFLLGSETASTVSSRGVYKFPVVEQDYSQFASYSPNYDPTAIEHADGQCSSYDVEWCPWSNLPDDDWVWQDDKPWVIGEFVWTGYDYLGEPTPYDEYWPSRSSYFGICDLAGLPKDRYFLYRSHWNHEEHTLHVLPHWTWPGREGEVTPVYVYTDYPEAELFVNGKSQGRRKKVVNGTQRLDRYRLRWNDVKYEPGTIEVVAYDANGHEAARTRQQTAGEPQTLKLEADRTQLNADGDDIAFVTVSMQDANGTFCPTTDDELEFEVTGEGRFQAVCNGDATSLEPFTEPKMRLFSGQLVVLVRTTQKAGPIMLTVKDRQRGLSQQLTLVSK